MTRHIVFGLLLAMTAQPVIAQQSFNGTWKTDLGKSKYPSKPDVFILQDGRYRCPTCSPPIDVKADGKDQPVIGHPRYDTMRVGVIDDRTVMITEKKKGHTVQTLKTVISEDGNTAYWEFGSDLDSDHPVTGKGEDTRMGPGPAGSHAISGAWHSTKMSGMSDSGLLITYKLEGDRLTVTTARSSYQAKLDGPDAPVTGDPDTTSVSVKLIDESTIEQTNKRDGKTVSVSTMTVSPDGKTLKTVTVNKEDGAISEEVADRQ